MSKELYLYNPIFSFVAEELLTAMEENAAEDIVIRVNSPGGSVNAGWGVIAKIQERTAKTTIKVDGAAMSMAAVALLFADRVEALDVSTIMLHRADMYVENDEDQKYLDKINKDIRAKMEQKIDGARFKEVSGYDIKDLFESKDRINVFLSAKQAKAIGIVDVINKVNPKEVEAFNNKFFQVAASADTITTNKKSTMDINKLKAEHPDVYAQAVAEGVAKEKARAKDWIAFAKVDPEAVAKGIESGESLTVSQAVELAGKKNNASALGAIEGENTEKVVTAADKTEKEKKDNEAKEAEAFNKALEENIKKFNKR